MPCVAVSHELTTSPVMVSSLLCCNGLQFVAVAVPHEPRTSPVTGLSCVLCSLLQGLQCVVCGAYM